MTHGTFNGYTNYKCRCDICRSFMSGYFKGKPRAYSSWRDMKARCLNNRHPWYKYYGGRGIMVCKDWHSFDNFYADMGERPKGYSIERIDVNGDYTPSNCKWIPMSEQSKNRRCVKREKVAA